MEVNYSKAVIKDVQKIKDKKLISKIELIVKSVKEAKTIEGVSGVKKMKGHSSAYRIRVGDYRLGFYLMDEGVLLARFVKRNDIYKLFP
jgi:mRNA interferase RelE/StbE